MTNQITPIARNRKQAAEYLGISVQTIDHLREAGHLPSRRIGRRVLIRTADLDALIAAEPEEKAPDYSLVPLMEDSP